MTIAGLLDVLWCDYVASTPQARRIRELLTDHGEILRDDHIALRSYAVPGSGVDALARPFEALGWRASDRVRFADRHVRGRCWRHDDPELPRVVISELAIDELSPAAQSTIGALVDRRGYEREPDARPWQPSRITHAQYRALHVESEYAAWVAAFGPGVHHFTVDLHSLSTFPDLEALGAFLIEHGFRVEGGQARGKLEQLSTRPEPVMVAFADGRARVSSGHYEFARRDPRAAAIDRHPAETRLPWSEPSSAASLFPGAGKPWLTSS